MSTKKFKDIFWFAPKSKIKAGDGLDKGRFPFYTSSQILSKYYHTEQHFDEALIFGTGGSASIHFADEPFSTSTDCIVAICKDKNFSTKFVYYYLSGNIHILERGFKGAGLKHISKKYIQDIEIPVFDIEIQNKVVTILDKASALVQKRQKSIDLLDEFLNAQFLEMFGQVAHFEKIKNSEPLGNYISIKHGFAFKSQYFTDEGKFILLTPGNFKEEGGYRDRAEKQKFYDGPIPDGYLLKEDDLLVAMTEQAPGLLGSPVLIPQSNIFLHNQRLGLVEFKNEDLNKHFLYYLFNIGLMRNIIHVRSTGVKVKHTSPTKIEAIEVTIPPFAKQEEFSMIAKKIEATITKNSRSLEKTNELFLSLLQRAFSGKLNLDVSIVLDALLAEIDLQKTENDLYSIITNEEYLLNLVNRLNNQEFETQDLYDKAKHVVFQLLKVDEILKQKYDETSKTLKLVIK